MEEKYFPRFFFAGTVLLLQKKEVRMLQVHFDRCNEENIWIDFRKENECGDVVPATITTAGDRHFQEGSSYYKNQNLLQKFSDRFMILLYTQRGMVKFFSRRPDGTQEEYEVGPEQCFFITSDGEYEFRKPDASCYSFIYIGFRGPLAEHVFARVLANGPVHRLPRDSQVVEEFNSLFRRGLHNDLNFCELRRLATDILLDLERDICDREAVCTDAFLRGISEWANENIAEMTVQKLAAHCRMSVKYFQSYFRKRCGMTPGKFLADLRMNYVIRLLECSGMKLSSIAEVSGFSDASHLCRVFRKQHGITPEAFRSGSSILKFGERGGGNL